MPWGDALDLFGLAIVAALLAGLIVPWVGCLLHVRRTSFYGIVLPELAAAGIACGFALLPVLGRLAGFPPDRVRAWVEDSHRSHAYLLFWAGLFTFGGLWVLSVLAHRRSGHEVGRLAATFVLASAATVLFAQASPVGEIFVTGLLRGEILFVGPRELATLGLALGLSLLVLLLRQRDLVLTSFDPETAAVLGRPIARHELYLALVTGLTVSGGALAVGPVVLFGLLVLPPAAARPLARSMRSFFALASAFGLSSAALGLLVSFELDLPLGPCLVLVAAALALPPALLGR